jgi:hypothetical protein
VRRVLSFLCVSVLAATVLALTGSGPVQATSPLTGRLVDSTNPSATVAGAEVRLRKVTGSGVGDVVDTDTTDSEGHFSLDAGSSPDDEYYVQVMAGRYQGGYIGDGFVQPNAGSAMTYGPSASLGKVLDNPAFIRGRLVNSVSGAPVRNVKVSARSDNDPSQIEGADTTNRNGAFAITGLECEDDCYLKVAGSSQGYETGFRACDAQVVPTFGEACASPIGKIGKVFVDKS